MNIQRKYAIGWDFLGALLGLVLGVSVVEWGAAVILDDPAVGSGREFQLMDLGQPTNLRYWLVLALTIGTGALLFAQRRFGGADLKRGRAGEQPRTVEAKTAGIPKWLVIVPLIWIGWQILAAGRTVDLRLTEATMKHFLCCVGCYFLGWAIWGRSRSQFLIVAGTTVGLSIALFTGFTQQYGGLRETREFYERIHREDLSPKEQAEYDTPAFRQMFESPEFQKRIQSDRIFGTLMYPNTFAGAILLLLPVTLAGLHRICRRTSFVFRATVMGSVAYIGVACLVWSGSKAGWLIGLTLLALALYRQFVQPRAISLAQAPQSNAKKSRSSQVSPVSPAAAPVPSAFASRRSRIFLVGAILGAGLIVFGFVYADYFRRGAPSAGARIGYWTAAAQTAWTYPLFGTGPGTFSIPHSRLKAPEAEMARLVHNDYVEQASDSGWIGCIAYLVWILGGLFFAYRRGLTDDIRFYAWLGCVAFALQSLIEFGLYVPALAWPAFVFLGGLVGGKTGGKTGGN